MINLFSKYMSKRFEILSFVNSHVAFNVRKPFKKIYEVNIDLYRNNMWLTWQENAVHFP